MLALPAGQSLPDSRDLPLPCLHSSCWSTSMRLKGLPPAASVPVGLPLGLLPLEKPEPAPALPPLPSALMAAPALMHTSRERLGSHLVSID